MVPSRVLGRLLRSLVFTAGGFLLLTTLSACTSDDAPRDAAPSPSVGSPEDSFVREPAGEGVFGDHGAFKDEYVDAAQELDALLPADTSFPDEPLGEWDPDGKYEEGVGYMHAAFFWQCAWLREYAEGDEERRLEALENLRTWPELPRIRDHMDEHSLEVWEHEVVDAAAEGEDGFLLALAENC